MKSMVMALFLLSVAAGNLFTSAVNSYIQVDSPLDKEVSDALSEIATKTMTSSTHHDQWNMKSYPGFDKKMGTADDLTIHFNNKAVIKKRDLPAEKSLLEASMIIQDFALANDRKFPLTEKGQKLIDQLRDPWDQQLTYKVINSTTCRITSSGPDKTLLTPWDSSLKIELKENKPEDKNEKQTWLEKRKSLLKVSEESDHTHYDNKDFKHTYAAGGLYKMEGANYFWFFTGLMFVTAVIFVPYAVLFKNNTEE